MHVGERRLREAEKQRDRSRDCRQSFQGSFSVYVSGLHLVKRRGLHAPQCRFRRAAEAIAEMKQEISGARLARGCDRNIHFNTLHSMSGECDQVRWNDLRLVFENHSSH